MSLFLRGASDIRPRYWLHDGDGRGRFTPSAIGAAAGHLTLGPMTLPPGAEDLDYKGYHLEVRPDGPGYKVFIYPADSIFPLPKTPYRDAKADVITQAKAIVDAEIAKKLSMR